MNDDYVEWDVHATTDVLTPRMEYDDPLTQFSETKTYIAYIPTETKQKNIPTTSSPILESSDSDSTSSRKEIVSSQTVLPMKVTITDPKKHHDPTQAAYISYLITTTTDVETFSSSSPRPVRRRYQDFLWLHTALTLDYPACIIPPLPDKHRLEYIKGDRFSQEFIQRRQISLQWFLNRIAKHPILQKSQCTRIFLESTDFVNDKRSHVLYIPPTTSLLDSISDTLINAFAKIKKTDERFEEIKESVDKLEENLNLIDRLYVRINKRQQDIQADYSSFADSIQGLSSLETTVKMPLYQFAESARAYSKAMSDMIEKEELQFINKLHELLGYCSAGKEVLKSRDQKQLDFEELSVYLNQLVQLKDHTQFPGKKFNHKHVGPSGIYIQDFVSDKLKEVRGVNKETARKEKLAKLDRKIQELQDEVTSANDESNLFSSQVLKEFELFQEAKALDLKQALLAYSDCHIEFYQKGIEIWENIIPILENMSANVVDNIP